MYTPPAVRWHAGRSRLQWRVLALVALLLLCLNLACSLGPAALAQPAWLWAMSLCTWLAAGWGCYKTPSAILCWTGTHWLWQAVSHNAPARVECVLEFPGWVLLKIDVAGQPAFWLWLEQGPDAGHWSALRRALVFTQGLQSRGLEPAT